MAPRISRIHCRTWNHTPTGTFQRRRLVDCKADIQKHRRESIQCCRYSCTVHPPKSPQRDQMLAGTAHTWHPACPGTVRESIQWPSTAAQSIESTRRAGSCSIRYYRQTHTYTSTQPRPHHPHPDTAHTQRLTMECRGRGIIPSRIRPLHMARTHPHWRPERTQQHTRTHNPRPRRSPTQTIHSRTAKRTQCRANRWRQYTTPPSSLEHTTARCSPRTYSHPDMRLRHTKRCTRPTTQSAPTFPPGVGTPHTLRQQTRRRPAASSRPSNSAPSTAHTCRCRRRRNQPHR